MPASHRQLTPRARLLQFFSSLLFLVAAATASMPHYSVPQMASGPCRAARSLHSPPPPPPNPAAAGEAPPTTRRLPKASSSQASSIPSPTRPLLPPRHCRARLLRPHRRPRASQAAPGWRFQQPSRPCPSSAVASAARCCVSSPARWCLLRPHRPGLRCAGTRALDSAHSPQRSGERAPPPPFMFCVLPVSLLRPASYRHLCFRSLLRQINSHTRMSAVVSQLEDTSYKPFNRMMFSPFQNFLFSVSLRRLAAARRPAPCWRHSSRAAQQAPSPASPATPSLSSRPPLRRPRSRRRLHPPRPPSALLRRCQQVPRVVGAASSPGLLLLHHHLHHRRRRRSSSSLRQRWCLVLASCFAPRAC